MSVRHSESEKEKYPENRGMTPAWKVWVGDNALTFHECRGGRYTKVQEVLTRYFP